VQTFHDAALVLLGHGTTLNPDSEKPVLQHSAELRKRRIFADVQPAFWKQPPVLHQVLEQLRTPRVFIVPFFLTAGYFSDQVIPKALGFGEAGGSGARILSAQGRRLIYTQALGCHEGFTDLVLARAEDILKRFPFPRRPRLSDTALFIAGHGTERNANSRKSVDRQVDRIRELGIYHSVHAVFMEEEPRIAAVYELASSRNIVVVPYFISDGLHAREDIPVLLGDTPEHVAERIASGQPAWRNPTERRGKLVWYTSSLGSEPVLSDVVLRIVEDASSAVSVEVGRSREV
jgi:sirohydrochlorin cobaltochelatase